MSTAERNVVSTADQDADRALKAKHRALWASGDYPAVAAELIPEFGPELVRACGVKPGDRVLDVAAGSGNAAIPAAAAGAIVTASDLAPELFDVGRAYRRRAWRRARVGRGRRGGDAVRGQQFRRGDVLRRRDVRAAPPGHRRRAGPHGPAGRHHRDDQLDARGFHRQPVRDHEALCAAATSWAPARRRYGAMRITCGRCSVIGSPT